MAEGELILYTTEDGAVAMQLRAVDGSVWLTQAEMAELFQTTKQNVSLHLQNIFEEGELADTAVVKEYLTTAADGKAYMTNSYKLEAVLAVGYRVRSPRGTQFRRWATATLREYLVKGFVMNDERLKDPAWDYFDELMVRIRDIRASEARFYQKVRDILALSADYEADSRAAQEFYATVQNRMLYAVAGGTAAELIASRANSELPNMGLTTWKGAQVRKTDVVTAKNYLGETEVRELNLIVTMFLDTAELRATRRQTMKLAEWQGVLDTFLRSNELPLLRNAGSLSAEQVKELAHQRYERFDIRRKEAERLAAANTDDLAELQRIAKATKKPDARASLKPERDAK